MSPTFPAFLPAPPSPLARPSLAAPTRRPPRAALDEPALRAANARFYDAYRKSSPDAMPPIFLPTEDVSIAAPSHNIALGHSDVAFEWARIFANARVSNCDVDILRAEAASDIGWVLCRQVIEDGRRTESLATNIFRACDGDWRLAHHTSCVVREGAEEGEGVEWGEGVGYD